MTGKLGKIVNMATEKLLDGNFRNDNIYIYSAVHQKKFVIKPNRKTLLLYDQVDKMKSVLVICFIFAILACGHTLKCPTCQGDACRAEEVPLVECEIKHPFSARTAMISAEASYGCLQFTHFKDGNIQEVKECIVTTPEKDVCQKLREIYNVQTCKVRTNLLNEAEVNGDELKIQKYVHTKEKMNKIETAVKGASSSTTTTTTISSSTTSTTSNSTTTSSTTPTTTTTSATTTKKKNNGEVSQISTVLAVSAVFCAFYF